MRFLKYTVLAVLALPLLLLVVMLVVGAFDEELNPEVVDLVRRVESERIAEQGNAYFALLGFQAPAGTDIVETGRKIYAADMRQLELARQGLDHKSVSQSDRSNFVKFKGEFSSICSISSDFLYENGICRYQAETDRMLADNRELLVRYHLLFDYHVLEEPVLGFWWTNEILSVQRLALAEIESKFQSGRVSEATSLLIRQLTFWEALHRGKYALLSESVLHIGYALSIGEISELIWRWPQLLRNADLRAAVAKPLSNAPSVLQAQMDRTFMPMYFARNGSDLVFFPPSEADDKPLLKWFANRLYRRNATLNTFHACLKEFYVVRALTGTAQEKAIQSFRGYEGSTLRLITNLTGELGLHSACPKDSWLEGVDISRQEARRRLVMLQIMLLSNKTREPAIAAFLEKTEPSLYDPKTGKPAMWDPQHRVIYFSREGRQSNSGLWVRLSEKGGFNLKEDCPGQPKPRCN